MTFTTRTDCDVALLIAEGQHEGVVREDLDLRLATLSVLGSTNTALATARPNPRP